ncbi:MAG: flagellar biosynthetic protein FliO [Clostridia bacterium]|nr:flagellar biosynthetic protein FliO [Clostridia bacterium]
MNWLDGILTFIYLIFAFGLILGLAWLTTKLLASQSFKKYKNKNIRLLEGINVGPQKNLQLVKVGGKILLLGITKDRIFNLETFKEDELEVSCEEFDKNLMTFQDIWKGVSNGISKKNKEISFNEVINKEIDKISKDDLTETPEVFDDDRQIKLSEISYQKDIDDLDELKIIEVKKPTKKYYYQAKIEPKKVHRDPDEEIFMSNKFFKMM